MFIKNGDLNPITVIYNSETVETIVDKKDTKKSLDKIKKEVQNKEAKVANIKAIDGGVSEKN